MTVLLLVGLGMDVNATKMFKAMSFSTLPKVYDADALNLLAENENYDAKRIITPHPYEASRLLKCSVQEIESDRFRAVENLYKKYGGVVVLKGAGTLIFDGKETYICNAGNLVWRQEEWGYSNGYHRWVIGAR